MSIIVHQVTAGEVGKAWALLKSSMPDVELSKKIAFQLDFHDALPAHVEITSAIRGFSYEEYFLFMRTFTDSSPDVRKGRAYSHCLVMNLSEIIRMDNLAPILASLHGEIDKVSELGSITMDLAESESPPITENLKQRFNCIIRGISNNPTGSKTFIWVGQQHFERAAMRLWEILTPNQRRNLNFGINFNPRKILDRSINFISIPEALEGKFAGHSFDVVRKNDVHNLTEISELFLAGEPKAMERIEAFRLAMESPALDRSAMSLIVKGIHTYENLDTITDLRQIVTLGNIVAKFSPCIDKGRELKAQILRRVMFETQRKGADEILALRNFQCESFLDGSLILRNTFSYWLTNCLIIDNDPSTGSAITFIKRAYETPQELWFYSALEQGLSDKIAHLTASEAKILWKWIAFDPEILHLLKAHLLKVPEVEGLLCNAITRLNEEHRAQVLRAALELQWLNLYAYILRDYLSIVEAAYALLEVDKETTNFSRLEIIFKDASAEDKISVALKSGDIRCLDIAGKLISTQPALLQNLDVTNAHWQAIWHIALTSGLSVETGIVDLKTRVDLLFENLMISGNCNAELLLHIAKSPLGNLIFHPKREQLWPVFPAIPQQTFLETTAKALLEGISNGSINTVPADPFLSDYVTSKGITDFLYYNRGALEKTILLFQSFSSIPEHMIREYIRNYSFSLNKWTAIQLGALVKSRNYGATASIILYKVPLESSFIPAVEQCLPLYSGLEKLAALTLCKITNAQISPQEWWQIFLEIARKLYPAGPTSQKIWARAGGEEFDLLVNGTGRDLWEAALQKLRNKACAGDIKRKHLLGAMMEDYKQNTELKTLKDLWR